MTTYLWCDSETTGLGKDSKAVEVAWIATDESFNELARYESRLNPEVPIQYGAMATHGITEEMVADCPTIEQFMESANYPMRGDDVVFCAHNAAFDINYFGPWLDDPRKTLCTLKASRILYQDAESHKLTALKFMLGLESDHSKAHSAMEDVLLLVQLAHRMCAEFNLTLEDLMEVQNRPRPIKTMPFGKHKGKLLADLPDDYIYWLTHKAENLDKDLRAALEAL